MSDILSLIATPAYGAPASTYRKAQQETQAHESNLRSQELQSDLLEYNLAEAKKPAKADPKKLLEAYSAAGDLAYRSLSGIKALPPEQRSEAWNQTREMLTTMARDVGIPFQMDETYSDSGLDKELAETAYGQQLVSEQGKVMQDSAALRAQGRTAEADEIEAEFKAKYAGEKDSKFETAYNLDGSPLGTVRLAGGKAYLGDKEIDPSTILLDKQIDRGEHGGPGSMSRVTKAGLEKAEAAQRIEKALLERVKTQFSRDFLTVQGRVKGGIAKLADYVDMASKDQEADLARRARFNMIVNQAFNAYRVWVTGAAAAEAELKRLREAYINTDNSPTEFVARLQELMEGLERMSAVRQEMLAEGLTPRSMGKEEWSKEYDIRWGELRPEDAADPLSTDEFLESLQLRQELGD